MSTANNKATKQVSFSLFYEKLKELCRAMRTGILYFVSSENRSGQFVLINGQIVGVVYACQKGQKALVSLQTAPSVTYQFTSKTIPASQTQLLPATKDILSQLYTYQTGKEEDDSSIFLPTEISISEQQRQELERLTTSYLGPMAKPMVEKLLHQATDLQVLIQLLKQRIPDSEDAQTFGKQAEQLLF